MADLFRAPLVVNRREFGPKLQLSAVVVGSLLTTTLGAAPSPPFVPSPQGNQLHTPQARHALLSETSRGTPKTLTADAVAAFVPSPAGNQVHGPWSRRVLNTDDTTYGTPKTLTADSVAPFFNDLLLYRHTKWPATITVNGGSPVMLLDYVAPTPAPSPAVGGYYGDEPKKRRFVQKVGNKFLVFTDATKALNAAIAADKAKPAQVAQVAQEDAQVAQAPVEAPDAIVPVADVRAVATSFGHQAKLNELFTAKNYEAIVALYEQLVQQQDEEDVELLLLAM